MIDEKWLEFNKHLQKALDDIQKAYFDLDIHEDISFKKYDFAEFFKKEGAEDENDGLMLNIMFYNPKYPEGLS